jgi:hypothetical protein
MRMNPKESTSDLLGINSNFHIRKGWKMQAIMLVHGILGSSMQLGTEEIWPPSGKEIIFNHYGRIAKLRNPSAIATGIISQITSAYQVYGPIIKDIDAIVTAQGGLNPVFFTTGASIS